MIGTVWRDKRINRINRINKKPIIVLVVKMSDEQHDVIDFKGPLWDWILLDGDQGTMRSPWYENVFIDCCERIA